MIGYVHLSSPRPLSTRDYAMLCLITGAAQRNVDYKRHGLQPTKDWYAPYKDFVEAKQKPTPTPTPSAKGKAVKTGGGDGGLAARFMRFFPMRSSDGVVIYYLAGKPPKDEEYNNG